MDENTAWTNFTATGKIEDYLIYCAEKKTCPSEDEKYENIHKGTYTDRAELR